MARREYTPNIEPLVWMVVVFTAIMIVRDIANRHKPSTTELVSRAVAPR